MADTESQNLKFDIYIKLLEFVDFAVQAALHS